MKQGLTVISTKPNVKKTNPNEPNDKIGKMSGAYHREGYSITPFLRAQRHQTQFQSRDMRFCGETGSITSAGRARPNPETSA